MPSSGTLPDAGGDATAAEDNGGPTHPLHHCKWCSRMQLKKVEFRVTTALEPGMSLLISVDASQRRLGRTDLLLAKVSEVCELTIEEAYSKFPVESKVCNLRGRWGGRRTGPTPSWRGNNCLVNQNGEAWSNECTLERIVKEL